MSLLRALPLLLTGFRLLLGPAFVIAHARDQTGALLVVVGVAILTDWLDGFLARRLRVVSVAGKLLDPFADALFCMIVFVDFALHNLMPAWIVVLLACREVAVTFFLRPLALRRGVVIAARPLGKAKTGFQFAAIAAVSLGLWGDVPFASSLDVAVRIGFFVVLALSLASAGSYAFDLARALRKERGPDGEDRAA